MQRARLVFDTRQLPAVLDVFHLAGLLGCTPDYVSKLCRRGQIKAFKAGKGWRILKADALEFIGMDGEGSQV